MSIKEELEASHQQSLSKLEDYINEKKKALGKEHEDIHQLKDEWKVAWTKMMEALLVLERLEI